MSSYFWQKPSLSFLVYIPAGLVFKFTSRVNLYTTLMMSTGLTFGTISALYGFTHGIINTEQYSILVVVVILTAIIPTLLAQSFFEPKGREREALFKTRGGREDV